MAEPGGPGIWGRLEHAVAPLYRAMAVLAAVAGTAIVGLIGASVTMRYVTGTPFRFTEELVGLLMTAAFFLALPNVTLRGDHVRIRLVVSALPPTAQRWAGGVAALFGIVFCAWFALLAWPWLEFALARSIKSEAARLLLWPWMALLPLSFALTALALAIRGWLGDPPKPEH